MLKEKIKANRPYFILTALILVSCLIIYFDFIFGNKYFLFSDIGSDTKSQYLMWYSSFADKMRAGTFSFWDFKNGFGANVSMEGLYDPFQLLICVFGAIFGTASIAGFLIYVNILKIILAGLAMYYFLNCFNFNRGSKIILSYMYAFNGFMMVWGQHYQIATIVVYLPLLFAAVEQVLHANRRKIFVILMTFLIGIYSLYFCYMSLITVGVYCIVRLIQMDKLIKEKLKIFGTELLSMILGVGLSCFALLPVLYVILGVSPRVTSDATVFSKLISSFVPFSRDYYKMLIYRVFSNNLQGTINYTGYINYYEALNFCCSNLLVFLLFQYVFFLFKKSVSQKEKVSGCVTLLLLIFTFMFPTGGLIYNGFCYCMHRWSFAIIPVLIVLSAKALEEIIKSKKVSIMGTICYLILLILVYGKSYKIFTSRESEIFKLNVVVLCLTGIILIVGVYLFFKMGLSSKALCAFLLSIVCINLVSDCYVSSNYRFTINKDSTYISDVYNSDVNKAVLDMKDNERDFFRVEKTFISDPCNMMDPLAQNYYGINTYNSLINKDILKFNELIWKNIQIGCFPYQCFNKATEDHLKASLVALRYIMTNDENKKIFGFTKYKNFGNITVLKNNDDVALGRLYTKSVTEKQFEENNFNLENLSYG